jgi:hypothetical protein
MNKRSNFRREKRLFSDRLRIENPVKSLFRVFSSNVFGQDRSSSQSLWNRDISGGAPTSLIPVRIPIGRKQY